MTILPKTAPYDSNRVREGWCLFVIPSRRANRVGFALDQLIAISVTIEYNPNSTGVVRAIARSLHCLWLSIPTWARDSSKVTSIRQRRTNQLRICIAVCSKLVETSACGSNSPRGSLIKTHRTGTGKYREQYQMAVSV